MIDFLGQELKVGNTVVAISHHKTSSTLYLGRIIRLTDKTVVIKTIKPKDDWRVKDVMTVAHYKVVRVFNECQF